MNFELLWKVKLKKKRNYFLIPQFIQVYAQHEHFLLIHKFFTSEYF